MPQQKLRIPPTPKVRPPPRPSLPGANADQHSGFRMRVSTHLLPVFALVEPCHKRWARRPCPVQDRQQKNYRSDTVPPPRHPSRPPHACSANRRTQVELAQPSPREHRSLHSDHVYLAAGSLMLPQSYRHARLQASSINPRRGADRCQALLCSCLASPSTLASG